VSTEPDIVAAMNAAYMKYQRIYPATREVFDS